MKKTLILLSGKSGSGKTTFAYFLADEFNHHGLNVELDAFAKAVKDYSKEDFKPLAMFLNNYVEKLKNQIGVLFDLDKIKPMGVLGKLDSMLEQLKINDDNWYEQKTMTTRILLQAYGTTIFRNRVSENHWALLSKKKFIDSNSNIMIIQDCRFPNEIEVFNDLNKDIYDVITIRMERTIPQEQIMSTHESETVLDSWTSWNYIIDNKTISLDELRKNAVLVVDDILQPEPKEKIEMNVEVNHLIY
jgi:anion-transporting  ArsA/GET3 family ATPase